MKTNSYKSNAGGGSSSSTDPNGVLSVPLRYQSDTNDTTVLAAGNSYVNGFAYRVASAQGKYCEYELFFPAGTYSVFATGVKASGYGIATLSIDGASVATLDFYAASTAANSVVSATGISIAGGKRSLRISAATKNASSGGYVLNLSDLVFVKES